MFTNENVGLLGATDKKEKKKVIKMKDVFLIPNHLKDKYSKKEKDIKPKDIKPKEFNLKDVNPKELKTKEVKVKILGKH